MTYVINISLNAKEGTEKKEGRKQKAEDFGYLCMVDPETPATRFILNSYEDALQLAEILIKRTEVENLTLKYCK